MPRYIIHSKKINSWRHKGVYIHLTEHKGKRKLLVYTPVYKVPRYFNTLPQARAAIDKWEKAQYKKDKRKFD